MRKNLEKILVVLIVIAMVFSMAACGGKDDKKDDDKTAGAETMQIELTTAPVGVHPLKTNDSPSQYLNNQMYETLYRRTLDGTAYEPLLAADMPQVSEDGLTVTIPLREGVTFQDGTPFTSADVAYMVDVLKDPSYGSQRPSIVETIESYECPDDHTIVFHTTYPDGVLVAKLAHSNGAIVNSTLEKAGQDFLVDATGAGTGAYQYVSMVPGATYDFEAYEGYWGGVPDVKHITYTVVADEATAIARLQTGEADFAPVLLADSYDVVAAIPDYTTANEPCSAIYYISLRSDDTAINPLMANSDFRKVLLEAVDWDTYCQAMLNGRGTHYESIVGPTLVGYTPEMETVGCGYDPDDAKALVEANGWEGETVILLHATRQWQNDCAVFLQAELAKVGINVEFIAEEWAAFLSDAKTDDYFDFCILSWSNVTGDGQQMLEPNFSTKNGLRVKYNNAEFDTYVDNSARTTVAAERQEWMLKAVAKIEGDNIVRPVYSQNQVYCYNSAKYSNVVLDKGGEFLIREVKINK